MYCRYIITFERELIAEPEDTLPSPSPTLSRENKQSVVSALTNPSGILSIDNVKSTGGPIPDDTPVNPLNICFDSDLDHSQSPENSARVPLPSEPTLPMNEIRRTPLSIMNSLINHMNNEVLTFFL